MSNTIAPRKDLYLGIILTFAGGMLNAVLEEIVIGEAWYHWVLRHMGTILIVWGVTLLIDYFRARRNKEIRE